MVIINEGAAWASQENIKESKYVEGTCVRVIDHVRQ